MQTRTRDYAIFGGCLRSELEFPELRPIDGAPPAWTLRVDRGAPPADAETLLGSDDIPGGPVIRLLSTTRGFRLSYTDTGTFDITDGGRAITWFPGIDGSEDLARMDVMSRVLSTSLHAAGALSLHASAVAIGGGGVGFLAPKFYGKSTLALALTYAGARLITDDTLAVIPGAPVRCTPGVHSIRLRQESAARVWRGGEGDATTLADGRLVSELPEQDLMQETLPLRALYLLEPVPPASAAAPVERHAVPGVLAALSIVSHGKMAGLLGASGARDVLDHAGAITRTVPVYRLAIVRDLDRLDAVTAQIIAWHEHE